RRVLGHRQVIRECRSTDRAEVNVQDEVTTHLKQPGYLPRGLQLHGMPLAVAETDCRQIESLISRYGAGGGRVHSAAQQQDGRRKVHRVTLLLASASSTCRGAASRSGYSNRYPLWSSLAGCTRSLASTVC